MPFFLLAAGNVDAVPISRAALSILRDGKGILLYLWNRNGCMYSWDSEDEWKIEIVNEADQLVPVFTDQLRSLPELCSTQTPRGELF